MMMAEELAKVYFCSGEWSEINLLPSTRFPMTIVVVTKLIQSITLHSKYSWLKEVTLERYSSVTLEEILWMSNLKELKMMINRWQTIDWARGGQNGECQVQLWQNWRTMSLILRAWLNDWVCVNEAEKWNCAQLHSIVLKSTIEHKSRSTSHIPAPGNPSMGLCPLNCPPEVSLL